MIAFSRSSLYTFFSRNPTYGTPPHAFGFPNVNTSPCRQNSIIVNPPSPSEIQKAVRGIGMDIFWNRPFSSERGMKSIFWNHTVVLYRIQMFICLRRSNPLTPTAFCQKRIFWTLKRFSGWIWTKLAPIYSNRDL